MSSAVSASRLTGERLLWVRRRRDQAGLAFLFQSIAVALDDQRVTVVQPTVENRRGEHGSASRGVSPWPSPASSVSASAILPTAIPLGMRFANRAAWQLPLLFFFLTLIPAAMHASWTIYEGMLMRFAKASDDATDLRNQLAERVAYGQLAHFLSHYHREASESWINLVPSTDQALAEGWRPKANPWFALVKHILKEHRVPTPDIDHFEVVNNLDIQKFSPSIPDEVRKMWVRVERFAGLIKKYDELAREWRDR